MPRFDPRQAATLAYAISPHVEFVTFLGSRDCQLFVENANGEAEWLVLELDNRAERTARFVVYSDTRVKIRSNPIWRSLDQKAMFESLALWLQFRYPHDLYFSNGEVGIVAADFVPSIRMVGGVNR